MNRKGFSLIELLIVLLIFSIVLIIAYSAFITFHRTSNAQENLLLLNQNLKATVNIISRYIRMAGFGTKYSLIYEGKSVNGFSNVFTPQDNAVSGSDQLTVVFANRIVGTVTSSGGQTHYKSNVINVATDSSLTTLLDNNLKKYVFIERCPYNQFFELSGVSTISGGLQLTLPSSTQLEVWSGDKVYAVRAISILYDSTNQEIDINENVGGSNQSVASWIETIQFQYGIDENDDGVFDDTDGDGNPLDNTIPASKEEYVRIVRISILGRTKDPDKNYKDKNNSYVIANHTITLDKNDSNGITSKYDWHYRRKLIQLEIAPRNFANENL